MTVAARQSKAQILEVKLQKYLQAAGSKDLPLYISCDFRDNSLTVVGEHPRSLVLKAKPTFAVLEAAILELEPQSIQQIGLCLKITGQKQPYAFHSFTMHNPVLSRPKPVEVRKKATETGIVVANAADAAEELPLEKGDRETGIDEEYFPNFSESANYSEPIAFTGTIPGDFTDNPFDPQDLEGAIAVEKAPKHSPFLALAVAGIVSVAGILLASGFYVFSRPCVIGECTALADAKQLSQNSANTLRTSKVANSPQEAQEQLKQAIALLQPIPPWSIHRGEAQTFLANYQQQSQNLNSAIDAAKFATSAAQRTKNPPYSVENWEEAQTMWESAIAQLGEIPTDSPVYPFAQRKLKEYQKNLSSADRRLTTEQKAEKRFLAAKSTAQIAEALELVAQSADSWDKVQVNWQNTIDTLSEIPAGTTSHQQAKVLVPKYETKLSQARERKNVEGISEDAYTQAVTLAAQARIFEARNGWFKASEYWRRALSYAEQVPAATAYSQKAKPLIGDYKTSLQQAEVKLEEERNLQKARTDLDRTCKGNPKICDYTVSKDLIAVQMTPGYVQKLQQTFIQAENTNATKTRQAVENHVETLKKALEAIGDNAKIPMQVYDGEGKRIATQTPN
ncbi:MAG: hypothetical protein HC789_17605 [Microcoleus sp. CSU_2_2]|nr:hypothetical protein [Microcoleus sp. SU_5_3]NJS12058.1 hypothetical protein [Microcoleus sp. CSU_2_2]